MTTTDRHPARNQILPAFEADLLNTLEGYLLYARVRELYNTGWTLRAIGDALEPQRPRSTVRYWVTKPIPLASAAALPIPTAPIPIQVRNTTPKIKRFLTASETVRIASIAPVARKYRASMNPAHPAAVANAELTAFCYRLYQDHVPIREMAKAASVSYRAMARRIERAA